MVVSSIATVGNYEYGFFWYFYLDGTIQAEVKLTGIIQTQAVRPGERVPYANPVTPELAGPHHQHVFSYRLDFTLDGAANAVYEVDAVPVPTGPDNPYGNAFTAQATLLETELQAQRMAAAEKSRYWKIVNHGVRNAVGEPVAYKLVPAHATAPLLAQPDAAITARAMFGTKHLWVTPFAADERRAAGDFPNQHPGGDGLPRWTAADRPVVDTDIVVWHTVGVTHFCRPEDFPVMPVEYTGFTLKPFGFFDRNPAIDLAPSGVGRAATTATPSGVTGSSVKEENCRARRKSGGRPSRSASSSAARAGSAASGEPPRPSAGHHHTPWGWPGWTRPARWASRHRHRGRHARAAGATGRGRAGTVRPAAGRPALERVGGIPFRRLARQPVREHIDRQLARVSSDRPG